MLLSKIVLRKSKQMDRHRFYQNIRNGAKEAKRANQQRQPTTDDSNPTPLASAGRKTTRFDTSNLDDDDRSAPYYNDDSRSAPHHNDDSRSAPRYNDDSRSAPRYNTEDSAKVSMSGPRTPRQERSFHETIYSPRTDRRGRPTSQIPEGGVSPRAEGGFLGGRDRSHERKVEEPRVPILVEEDSNNTLMTENKLLKIEMDDLNSQLEVLKNEQENTLQRFNETRKQMERTEREHLTQINEMKDKLRDLQASKAGLAIQLEAQKKKTELMEAENDRLRSELQVTKEAVDRDQKAAKATDKLKRENDQLEEEVKRLSKQVEKLTLENSRLKEHETRAERVSGLEEKLGQIGLKLDRKRQKLTAARKDINHLRKTTLSPEQEAELKRKLDSLASSVKAKDMMLEQAKKEHRDTQRQRDELEDKCRDLKDQFITIHSEINSSKKANDDLANENKNLEEETKRLKNDNEQLKEQNREEKENALKLLRFTAMEEKINPLKESIREKDVKITNLEKEVDTLRHAVQGYQKQIDALRQEGSHQASLGGIPNPDHATAHRRLLDENSRLLTMLEQYRQLVQPPLDPQRLPKFENSELEDTKRHLKASEFRVAQLEQWLDEIYNDKNFDIVRKNQRAPLLPDLPKRYLLSKSSTDTKKPGFSTDRAL